jgi:hypothetical protein
LGIGPKEAASGHVRRSLSFHWPAPDAPFPLVSIKPRPSGRSIENCVGPSSTGGGAEVVKVARAEIAADKALLFAKAHPAVAAEHFEIVQAGANEVAIVSLDGEPKHLILPNTTRAFWKTLTKVDVERIDATTEVRVAKRHLDKLDPARSPMVVYGQVEAHEAGLLFIDGKSPPSRELWR